MEKTEGIICDTLPFRDYDRILTVFTREHGLIKLIVHGATAGKKQKSGELAPLTCGEFIYRFGKGEMHRCREFSPIAFHLNLRRDLNHLAAACDHLQALQQSQAFPHPAPKLYDLLLYHLERIHLAPEALAISFRLKILRHEGILDLTALPHREIAETLAYSQNLKQLTTIQLHQGYWDTIKRAFHQLFVC